MVFKATEGSGASGSFFFFSSDFKLIIKTIKKNERELLVSMLDEMVDHIVNSDNESLIARIYGVFTLTTNMYDPLDFIIMQNTAQLFDRKKRLHSFDLKGST
jgi:1-phosphatidylinositol-4-phosphate 5-kinase